MTQEKICFRYDGSEDSRKCIEWINKGNPMYRHYCGFNDELYAPDGSNSVTSDLSTHRLVPPAEFLRIVRGESEWQPKYGEEVEVSDDKDKVSWLPAYYCCPNPNPDSKKEYPHCVAIKGLTRGGGSSYRYIRPVRKSLREELSKLIPLINADDIINLFKQHKDEL